MTTPSTDREQSLVQAFVRLADTLVADYDVIELFHALCADCVALLGVDAAGLMLSDQDGTPQVVSASTEAAQLVELFQLQTDEGACLDAFRTGRQVVADDLGHEARWPQFTARTAEHGFAAVHALPMQLRGTTIGALNLFHRRPHAMPTTELAVGQALADVATIAILSDRNARDRERRTEQLQGALSSRVVLEQAKGILAERGRISLDDAFARLRAHARATRQLLTDVARGVVDDTCRTENILGAS